MDRPLQPRERRRGLGSRASQDTKQVGINLSAADREFFDILVKAYGSSRTGICRAMLDQAREEHPDLASQATSPEPTSPEPTRTASRYRLRVPARLSHALEQRVVDLQRDPLTRHVDINTLILSYVERGLKADGIDLGDDS